MCVENIGRRVRVCVYVYATMPSFMRGPENESVRYRSSRASRRFRRSDGFLRVASVDIVSTE